MTDPVMGVCAAIKQAIAKVHNTIDKLITQLSHLALTTRYQVIKMKQYIRESKGWLIVNDWKFICRKKKYIHN